MINIGKAIYSIVTGSTGITSIIGNKIFPIVIPEKTDLPVIVYERNCSTEYTRDGIAVYSTNIDFTILSSDYTETITIGEELIKVFNNYSGSVNGINIINTRVESINETFAENTYIQKLTLLIKSY